MKSDKTSIKKNFFYQMIYEVLILILPFVTSPYISRVIGANGLGIFSYSYTIAFYFVLFSMLGIKNYGNRSIAMVRDDQDELNNTFSEIAFIHILVSLVCTSCYIFYIIFKKEDQLYALIQFFYVLSGLFDISWFYFGIEKFKLTVTRNTIIKVMTVISVFLFVRTKDDLWIYCLIISVGNLISQIALWFPLHKYVKFIKPDWRKAVRHLKPLSILFIPAVAVSLYKYMDKIMIGTLSSKIQLGFYENADKVVGIPLTIIVSFGTVMLPKMSNLAKRKDSSDQANKLLASSMKYVMCLAFALSFGLAGIGKVFAPVFWGEDFDASGLIIMGLSVTIPFIAFADVIRTQFLIPKEKDKEYLVSVICGAVLNIAINFFLIPILGALGAMIGTIIAEITVCFIQGFVVRKELPLRSYFKNITFFLFLGIVMFFSVYVFGVLLGDTVITLIVQIISGIIVYGLFSIVYFYKTNDEMIIGFITKLKKHFNLNGQEVPRL